MTVSSNFASGAVHLVYCESGIETAKNTASIDKHAVHLVYCESGIETIVNPWCRKKKRSSFSLLRERY